MRLLACGDLHAGHIAGWCPARYHARDGAVRTLQRELHRWTCETVRALQPVDVLLINGDAINGKGARSRGNEHVTTDRVEQARWAAEFVEMVNPRALVLTWGTPYHTGECDLLESAIADAVDCPVQTGNHELFTVGGVTFSARHKIGSSSIPHGRATALMRSTLWQRLWEDDDRRDKADVILRSHVHYHVYAGQPGRLAMTLPALQAAQTEFGARECDGLVDFGMVVFDCDQGEYSWQAHLLRPRAERARARNYDHTL